MAEWRAWERSTFQYFAVPAVSDETGPLHTGTTTLPTTPTEVFVFGRGISRQGWQQDRAAQPLTTMTA